MKANINFFIFFWKRKGKEKEEIRKRLSYVRLQIGFGIISAQFETDFCHFFEIFL